MSGRGSVVPVPPACFAIAGSHLPARWRTEQFLMVAACSRWHARRSQGTSVSRMRNESIIVQKYGGACLETPAKIRAVAVSLADLHSRGYGVVAIVSAM